jgi:uncharacterized protein (TIGR03083 family)
VPTTLTIDEHLAALDAAGARLIEQAESAGGDAAVPTCPAWDVDALVAHQAMVHRWATANVRGDDVDAVPNQTTIRSTVSDLPGYFREGHAALVEALRAAPPDLEALRFLNDAPPPRQFWARRQAHETTIHMVDAIAAALGREPAAAEVALPPAFAADGLDELLCGFFTRGRCKLYDGEEYSIAVVPTDVDACWTLHVAERMTTQAGSAANGAAGADATISGSAAGLYLALWNRGHECETSGRADVLARWHETQRVRWS